MDKIEFCRKLRHRNVTDLPRTMFLDDSGLYMRLVEVMEMSSDLGEWYMDYNLSSPEQHGKGWVVC